MKRTLRIALALLAALLAAAGILLLAPSAWAVHSTSHGVGYLSARDGRSWLGTHRLGDNNLGLCLEVTKRPPEGSDLTYIEGDRVGLRDADLTARLAFIAREFVTTTDPDWAAGAQLATWNLTGLGGHTSSWYAQRANEHALTVSIIADQIRDRMNGRSGASRSVAASVALSSLDSTPLTVRSEITVDFVGTGRSQLPPGKHSGTLHLTGAAFPDGSMTRTVENGVDYAITPTVGNSTADVSAVVDYTGLPYGNSIWVAKGANDVQTLLVPPATLASAHASTHESGISPLPFAPAVQTQASAQRASTGAALSDELELGVREPLQQVASVESVIQQWGLYTAPDGSQQPVPVTIDSTLVGPLAEAPTESPSVPADAPVVCTVHTLASSGPGRYQTPECVLPSPGFYVWVESIDPKKTPPDLGGERIQPWVSAFGIASEVTQVAPTTPSPTPPAIVIPPTGSSGTSPSPSPMPSPGLATSSPAASAQLASTGRARDEVSGGAGLVLLAAAGALVIGSGSMLVTRVVSSHERVHRRRR
ncbi:hypothetical protein KPL76_00605 [Subtercola sp. PAMC28395]|uniref:hypothetical protein n=1 Tax=Subtercola sp. PAMC28395 TaxID=2846775 RepID=UPI001C0BE550|nr:hypothetical protein [Subtercola sp. PAMC28395]QWT23988.1 hypothetical protein KPL76_00605 [Subtercola sp. PAMC28395]